MYRRSLGPAQSLKSVSLTMSDKWPYFILPFCHSPVPESPPGSPSNHDDFCPFSNQAREKKIELLKSYPVTQLMNYS